MAYNLYGNGCELTWKIEDDDDDNDDDQSIRIKANSSDDS